MHDDLINDVSSGVMILIFQTEFDTRNDDVDHAVKMRPQNPSNVDTIIQASKNEHISRRKEEAKEVIPISWWNEF